jgi:class 3 adenylate cyclase/tetratricopeptide (TPR) repeat protein
MDQINCPHCGRQNPHTHNFCSSCGRVLAESCPRCDFNLTGDVDFCGNCGLGLTPRSQFFWLGEQAPVDGRWTAPLPPRPPAEIVAPESEQAPEQPAAAERTGRPTLEQYIPAELMSKLDAARSRGKMDGERRIVTMLFCDLKGSTSAAGSLDPEEWTEIINGAFEYMIRPVYKYEGTVARLMGDGILAFFGAPIAHEDDPSRAVLAGLEIVEGLAPYRGKIQEQWGLAIDVRVGINTGLVVVGAVGSDLRMEYTAMGDAINLAARMEQAAAPGTVQIANDTYRQVAPLFDVEDLGGIEIKGKADPVPAYRVLGQKTTAGRTRGIDGQEAEMVGRAGEISRLQDVLVNLERGIGRIVCLLGDAGLGKSRLVSELRGNQSTESTLTWVESASLSYELSHPYALFQQLVRQINDIPAGEEPDQFWQKIQRLAAETPGGDESRYARVFAALFALPEPSGQPPLEGEQFKRELYAVMAQIWSARFAERPSVLVIDDLHWADSASVELLLHLLPAIETNPLVILCAFRPDRGAPSYQLKQAADADYPHRYSEINLRPLTEDESDELVNRLLAIADLPDSLRRRIWERSGGNPFYVEEVVRTLIENGAVVAEDRTEDGQQRRYWRAVSERAVLDIPENLQGLLISRIDRLEEETRHVLQLASVIGRSFYHRVLAEIGRMEDLSLDMVDQQVGFLVRLEMIQEAARVPDIEYRFRNPMTQEVAYQTILLKRRREFHRRVGAALEALFPDRLGEMATRLAYHYSEGRQADKALALFTRVGDQAFRLFALEQALQSYDQALEWAHPGDAGNEQLVHLYLRRGRILELMLRHDEALEIYKALEALGEAGDNDELRLAGLAAQGISYTIGKFDLENSRLYTDKALTLARELGDRFVEARALWSLLLSHSYFDGPQALEYGEQGLAIIRELVAGPESSQEHLDLMALILMDQAVPLVGAGQVGMAAEYASEAREIFEELGNLPMASTAAQRQGVAYKAVGRFEQALEVFDWSTEIDLSIGNEGGLVGSSLGLFDIYQILGDLSAVNARVELFRPILAREERLPLPVCELQPVMTYFQLGLLDKVLDLADDVWQFKESQAAIWPDNFLCYLARAHIRLGDLDAGRKALAAIDREVDLNNYMLPLTANLPQARAELALAAGEWQAALTVVDDFVKKIRGHGLFSLLPEKLLLRAQILCAAGQPAVAYETLQEARVLALEQGARPVSWRICAQLAGMEEARGNEAEAQSMNMDARAVLDSLAVHAGDEEIQALFLALPEVRSVLDRSGG